MDQTGNPQESHPSNKPSQSRYYEIRVQGQLDSTWSDWFDGLEVRPQENGETLIAGPFPDQAALFDILMRLFNLGLPLLSVRLIEPEF